MAKPKITRTITKKEWNKKHKDFKIMGRDGIPYIMAYDDKIGTHLVPVKIVDESVNEGKVDSLKNAVQKINKNYKVQISKHPVTKGEVEIILGSGNHPDKDYDAIQKLVSKLGIQNYSIFDESIEESLGAEIDLIMQNSNNLKDFIKKIFSDGDFKDMRNDKDFIKYLKAVYTENIEEGDGLWANIRAKRARGEKPAHGNSKAHKDAVKAGEKINKDEAIEEMDLNDPIMMKLRAAQMRKNKDAAKKIDTEKQNKNATKIKALKKKRAEVMRDMEQEAEPEGGKIADRYGKLLNRIDNDIIKLGGNPMSESVNEAYIVIYAKKKGEKPAQAAFQLRGSALSFERDLKKDGYITMVTQKKVKGIDEKMITPQRGHNYYQLYRDTPIKYVSGHSGIGLKVPGVLLHNEYDTIKGKEGAYIIDYFGAHFYVDMKNKFASRIAHPDNREQNKDLRKNMGRTALAPEHKDWKKYMNESVTEDTKKRFDVDFYKNDRGRTPSYEEIIRGDKFSDVVLQATKVAKSKGMVYVEFYYKDAFIGSIDKKNGYKFQKGRSFQKSPLSVDESSDVYHKSYTHAIEAAEVYARKKGYEIDDDEMFTKVGMNSKRPSVGKTTRVSLELLKNGKPQKKMLHIQVYGMKNGYELNAYIN